MPESNRTGTNNNVPESNALNAMFLSEINAGLQRFEAILNEAVTGKGAKEKKAVKMEEIDKYMLSAIEHATLTLARFTEAVGKKRGQIIEECFVRCDELLDLKEMLAQAEKDEMAAEESYHYALGNYLKTRATIEETPANEAHEYVEDTYKNFQKKEASNA